MPHIVLSELFDVLGRAARLHHTLRSLGWRSSFAFRALDQLATGVIVTAGDGRVIEVNRTAERIVQRSDGLMIRNHRLCARRIFESAKLGKLIDTAGADEKAGAAAGRMLIWRGSGRPAYVVTVAPLSLKQAACD